MGFSSVPRATSGMSVLYLRAFRQGASAPPSTAALDRQAQLLHTELVPAPRFLAAPSSHFLCEHHPKRGALPYRKALLLLGVLWSLACCRVGIIAPALPSLAPDCWTLHVGWEPAPGTLGPASLDQRPTL